MTLAAGVEVIDDVPILAECRAAQGGRGDYIFGIGEAVDRTYRFEIPDGKPRYGAFVTDTVGSGEPGGIIEGRIGPAPGRRAVGRNKDPNRRGVRNQATDLDVLRNPIGDVL